MKFWFFVKFFIVTLNTLICEQLQKYRTQKPFSTKFYVLLKIYLIFPDFGQFSACYKIVCDVMTEIPANLFIFIQSISVLNFMEKYLSSLKFSRGEGFWEPPPPRGNSRPIKTRGSVWTGGHNQTPSITFDLAEIICWIFAHMFLFLSWYKLTQIKKMLVTSTKILWRHHKVAFCWKFRQNVYFTKMPFLSELQKLFGPTLGVL